MYVKNELDKLMQMKNNELEVKNLSLKRYEELLKCEKTYSELTEYIYIQHHLHHSFNAFVGSSESIRISGKDNFKHVIKRYIKSKDNAFSKLNTEVAKYRSLSEIAKKEIEKLKKELKKSKKSWWRRKQ